MKNEETIANVNCCWGVVEWFGRCQCCSRRAGDILAIDFGHNEIRACEDCARALKAILDREIP